MLPHTGHGSMTRPRGVGLMAHVFVTGGSGFIGGHVVRHLVRRGQRVTALVRAAGGLVSGVGEVIGDLGSDSSRWDLVGIDAVVHAGGLVSQTASWPGHHAVNVLGTRRILGAAAAAGVPRFVHLSSLVVLEIPRDGVWRESSPRRPDGRGLHPYARAKLEAEREVDVAEAGGLGVVVIRPGLVLGPGDRVTTPQILRLLRRGLAVRVGDGTNRIPCVCVEELAEKIAKAALTPGLDGLRANLVAHESPTQRALLEAHAAAAGLDRPRGSIPVPLARLVAKASEAVAARTGAAPWLSSLAVQIASVRVRVEHGPAAAALGWRGAGSWPGAVRRAVAATFPSRNATVAIEAAAAEGAK